ncbi:hypothetical protein ACHAXT_005500 [Thalassiosira profunda]
MKEMAWVLEESTLMLPPNSKDAASRDELVLDFAWKHGSLRLREYLHKAYPSEVSAKVKGWNCEANEHLSRPTVVKFVGCNQEVFRKLRQEARNALRLGYRRSEAIETELNGILYSRWKEAVEELGEPGNCAIIDPFKPKQTRHRRRRRRSKNEALLEKALGQDKRDEKLPDGLQPVAIQAAALDIPPELTPLEDEVAWLVEESLILLPDDMLSNGAPTKCFLTAGLVTKSCEINWNFVSTHASAELKSKFEKMGGLRRRPLQRIIRYHQTEVRVSFAKRRDDIASLLLLRGYRRPETKAFLPSHDILITTGLNKVWAVRLLRRRQNEQSEDIASSKDLRSACNERVGDKRRSESSPKRQEKPKKPKLAATQKAQSTILTAEEEEIAWLREEYNQETGVAIYDWEFIEENSSVPLLISLAERKVAPSIFPSVPGVSKLSEMVRLGDSRVKEEYDRVRVNIRYAITQKGYRRDRSQQLPAIPAAPASFLQKPKRKTCVVDVEYAGPCAKKSGGASTNACADVGKKANGSIPKKSTLTDSVGDNLETEGEHALAFETDDYFTPDTNRVLPEGRTWYCDFCKTAQFDDYDEAVLHESYCEHNVDRCMNVDEKANDTRAFQPTGEHAKQEGSDSDGLEQDAKLDSFDLHLSGEESGEEEVVNDGDEDFTMASDDESEDEEFIEE